MFKSSVLTATAVLVFAILGLMPANAADAASPVVSIPWGDWVAAALASVSGLIVAAAGLAKALLPPIVRPFVTDAMISNAVHYAITKVSGAVAGEKLDVPAYNAVLRAALNYIVDNEPKAAKALGDKLGPLVAAKLSQLGSAPAEAVEIPRVFGVPVK